MEGVDGRGLDRGRRGAERELCVGGRVPPSSFAKAAETTAPSAATASSPAIRAIALFMPEAIPALRSSASASTAAVSGATVATSPAEKTISAGSSSVQ